MLQCGEKRSRKNKVEGIRFLLPFALFPYWAIWTFHDMHLFGVALSLYSGLTWDRRDSETLFGFHAVTVRVVATMTRSCRRNMWTERLAGIRDASGSVCQPCQCPTVVLSCCIGK